MCLLNSKLADISGVDSHMLGMIERSFYLSDETNLEEAIELTGLDLDELEIIVGRFAKHSHRAGKLRGEVLVMINGSIKIRHHFTKKKLWSSHSESF